MIIIPAIDLYQDSVVRLTKGDFDNVTYYKNTPLEQAKIFESLGFTRIHLVDLLGSKTGKFASVESLKLIKAQTKLIVQFGGGIRDSKSVSELFSLGINEVVIGSLAVKNKDEFELILKNNPPERIIAAADILDEKVKVSGWTEGTSVTVYEHIEYCRSLGISKFLCTDISRDGMLTGTNIDLYKLLLKRYPSIKLIISGGIKDIADVKKAAELNPYAVIVGKAIYEDKIDLKELSEIAV